ncbi:unnamed protein product [Acanthoscelides obtectus]|uniref:HTH psq-type domain-containing protein n=1 Tax=Acanthoscelides obtectus TaxID=200917 RepID=A0A9P0JW10_ACAOB|nr:unnamed protein product [Acanthoscelides obtectus]CAK1621300.1 hypothetical protein AOBTE_LOCUS880 [Acanthoscelides obtectus]
MVRTYKKKTARGIIPIEQYESAMQAILQEKLSIRDPATRYGVNFMTLHRYMKRKLALNVENRSKCLVGFPPHTSHKLQPLDRTVFGPLKRYFNSAADAWLRSNPGKVMNIYDIPTVLRDSFSLAVTPLNIQKGFKVTGIWPFNREIFQDDEFLPSEVTDRPKPENINTSMEISPEPEFNRENQRTPQPSTSSACSLSLDKSVDLLSTGTHITPRELKPYPKAMPRKSKVGRKKRVSAILTDTPIKSALEEEERTRQRKKNVGATKRNISGELTSGAKSKCKKQSAKKTLKKIDSTSSEEDEESACLICLTPFSHSRNEEWIQCIVCKGWAHVGCGKDIDFYVCIHCLSDSD